MLALTIDAAEILRWLDFAAARVPQVKKVRSYIQDIVITPDGKLQVKTSLKNLTVKPELTESGTIKLTPDFISNLALSFLKDKLAPFGVTKTSNGWEFSYAQLRENQPKLPDLRITRLTLADSTCRVGVTLS